MKLYDNLDPSRRNVILKYKQHHCEAMKRKELTFTPEITNKAKEIVNRLYTGENVTERLHRMHNERKERLFNAQTEKRAADMIDCTFYPVTTKGILKNMV
jgi:hypothetical protein